MSAAQQKNGSNLTSPRANPPPTPYDEVAPSSSSRPRHHHGEHPRADLPVGAGGEVPFNRTTRLAAERLTPDSSVRVDGSLTSRRNAREGPSVDDGPHTGLQGTPHAPQQTQPRRRRTPPPARAPRRHRLGLGVPVRRRVLPHRALDLLLARGCHRGAQPRCVSRALTARRTHAGAEWLRDRART